MFKVPLILLFFISLLCFDASAQRRAERRSVSAPAGAQVGISPGMQVLGALPRTETQPMVVMPAETAPSRPSAGLVINATYDSTITSQPNAAQIEQAIQNAITIYQNTFADPITVNIYFRYAATDPCNGAALPTTEGARSDWIFYTIAWTTFRNALSADQKSSQDNSAVASVPTTPQTANVLPTSANSRALGIPNTPGTLTPGCATNGGIYDGLVTLNSALSVSFTRPTPAGSFDAQRSIEHEIDEVLGIGSCLDFGVQPCANWRPEDLFSFSAPGTRNVSTTGTRYFSYDNGNTNVVNLNQDPNGGDRGDWAAANSCPQPTTFVQNYIICPGQASDISRTTPEGVAMDVTGYDLAITTAADVRLAGRVLAADGSALRNAKVLMFDAEGNTYAALSNAFGYYSFADVPSGKTYTVTVAAKGFAFQPRIVSLDDDLTGFDLVASP